MEDVLEDEIELSSNVELICREDIDGGRIAEIATGLTWGW
jgi:hypothetical protein